MGIVQWIIIILAIIFIITRFIPVKGVGNVSSNDVKDKLGNKRHIQFIDVRTPGEFQTRHQKPFKNIPLKELAGRIRELDEQKEIVVICQSGMRSMKAAKVLKRNGFEHITNVRGGMSAW